MTHEQKSNHRPGELIQKLNKEKGYLKAYFERQKPFRTIPLQFITRISILDLIEFMSEYALRLELDGILYYFNIEPSYADQRNLAGTGLRYNYTPDNAYIIAIYQGGYINTLFKKKIFEIVEQDSIITDEIEREIKDCLTTWRKKTYAGIV